jgi:dTDP-4-amino-4,6-dideoxygalactose transaminase
MVLTDDPEIYYLVQNLRDNGKSSDHEMPGTNSKMSEVDCAQMLVKLKHFDKWQQRRSAIAEYYIEELFKYVDIVLPTEGTVHAWHKFVIRTNNRNSLMNTLSKNFIESKMHYNKALYDLPVGNLLTFDHYMETNQFVKQCLSLPIYPELTDNEVTRVVEVIKHYYSD